MPLATPRARPALHLRNLILRTEVATPGNARVFEYDYRNRLVAVRDYTGYVDALNPGTLVMEAEYTYDVNNLRIKKVVDADGAGPNPAVTTGFVYDEGHVVLQFDGAAGMTNRYLYGPAVDQVLADERASGVLWALADNLGSVRDLVDSSGTPVNHVKYSAFGEKVSETAPATNFLFGYTGAVFEAETNLGYHRARYLDHATGRWINQDPIGFAGDQSNLYRYVGNTPTNATDPSGLAGQVASATVKIDGPRLFEPYPIKRTNPENALRHDHIGSQFTVDITFQGECGGGVTDLEYRQFVYAEMWISENHGPWQRIVSKGRLREHGESYVEDIAPKSGRAYGRRSNPSRPNDKYEGTKYHSRDTPGIPDAKHNVLTVPGLNNVRIQAAIKFYLKVIDTAEGNAIKWSKYIDVSFNAEVTQGGSVTVTRGENSKWSDEIARQKQGK